MSTFDAKSLRDKDDNDVNFTPTHYFDGNTKKNIAEEIGKKQDKVLQDEECCRVIRDNRLRLMVTELLNIKYLIDEYPINENAN